MYVLLQKEREIAEAEAASALMDAKEEMRDEAPILEPQAAEGISFFPLVLAKNSCKECLDRNFSIYSQNTK